MSMRIPYVELSKTTVRKLNELSIASKKESIEQPLIDLINLRVSQINGCSFCVDMHVKEATIRGEKPLRLHHLATWRESPLYSARERIALEWAEAVTHVSTSGVPDALYEKARAVLSEKEIADLTIAVAVINTWNRLAVSFRSVPGSSDEAFGIQNSGLS